MRITSSALMAASGFLLIGNMQPIHAQSYPTRVVRIVTSGAGSGNDFTSRLLAQGLPSALGQQVVVDNRASGVIPGETVAKAAPDGYTLLVYGGTLWIEPLMATTPYDVATDFAPISITDRAPVLIVANPTLTANSVRELIALVKASPGKLNYASAASGSGTHLAAELFKSMAGVNMLRVSYKSVGAALPDLISNQVQVMFPTGASVTTQIKSGRLKALAVASPQPSPLFPGLITAAASGLPGYEFVSITGIFAPAKTPVAIISRLHQEIVKVLQSDDVKLKFFNAGSEVVASTPDELAAAIRSDVARLGKVIKDAGIHDDQ